MDTTQGIIFDFGGVISMPQDGRFFPEAERLTGWTRAQILEAWGKWRRLFDADAITPAELYRRLAASLGQEVPEATLEAVVRLDFDSWSAPNAGTLAWARELKARGLKIGILTNMPTAFIPWFDRCAAPFRALADAEVISGRERLAKPDPAIYRLMERRIGLPPEALLFLDDSPANVEAARACGWRAIRFRDLAQARAEVGALP